MDVARGPHFVWLDVVVLKRKERTETSGLYELRGDGYVYIGGSRSVCGCGGIFQRVEGGSERPQCPLCGARQETPA